MRSKKNLPLMFLAASALLHGQPYPPAQGPAPASGTNTQFWPVFQLTNMVRLAAEAKVAEINAALAARDDIHATVVPSILSWSPSSAQTQYPDRPNSRYQRIPHILLFQVKNIEYKKGVWISYPWTRKISISLDLNVFCDKWQTGSGSILVVSDPQPPYLDQEHSGSEQIVDALLGGWLINLVNSKVRESMSGVGKTVTDLGFACATLSSEKGDLNTTTDDSIVWNKPSGFSRLPILTALNENMTVRPTSIKRLAAHSIGGGVLYQPVESPTLEFWADWGLWTAQLPAMIEGQEAILSAPPISIPKPAPGNSLVIIASMTHSTGPEDNAFQVYSSATNFGNGVQKIVVYKTYWRPPQPPLNKPTKMSVAAYEITFEVVSPQPVILGRF